MVNGTLTISNIEKADGGAYACVATNLLGEDSAVAQVTVLDTLKFKITPPQKVNVSASSKVVLHCAAQGALNIFWKKSGQALPQNHVLYPNGTLLLTKVSPNEAGSYSCEAKNFQRSIKATSVETVYHVIMGGIKKE